MIKMLCIIPEMYSRSIVCIHSCYITIMNIDILVLLNLAETILVQIDTTYHFVLVWGNGQIGRKTVTQKRYCVPFFIHDLFKEAILFFPKAPGAVIFCFGMPVNEEDFFVSELSAFDHPHHKAKRGTTCSQKYKIVFAGK